MSVWGFSFEVFGHVQGVYFRMHTEQKALALGLVGWVMNTKAGTVKGVAQGNKDKLEIFRMWLSTEGSPMSKIERCEIKDFQQINNLSYKSFTVTSKPQREEL